MDVRAENRGRPHQKVHIPAALVVGRNFLTPGHPGVRVRNVRGKSGPKSPCLCCFFFPDFWSFPIRQAGTPSPPLLIATAHALSGTESQIANLSLRAHRLKKLNLACNFQSRLKFSIPTFRIPHKKNRGLVDGSLEIFNLA